jgi:hypothetical protein
MKITPGPGDSTAPGTTTTPTTTTTTPATTTTDASSNAGLLSALQGLLNNGGYSATEQQAITEKAAEALAAQKGSSQAQMADQLARSGNAAGYGGAMSSLDNSAAQTASDQARQNQIDFANEQERQKELGASGLTSLLGINTAAQLGTSGQAAGLASLGGGVDTSTAGGSDFSNQNYQATPDASAKTTATPSGTTPGGLKTAGTDKNGNPVDGNGKPLHDNGDGTYTDSNGQTWSKNSDGTITQDSNIHPDNTDGNGLSPGDPGYDPTSDPSNPAFTGPGGGTSGTGGTDTSPGQPPPDTTPTTTDTSPGQEPPPDTTGDGSGAGADSLTVLKRLLSMSQ